MNAPREPESADVPPGPLGIVVVHGFGGSPRSVAPLHEALRVAGYAIVTPTLAGHATSVEDLGLRTWGEWTADVDAACDALAGDSTVGNRPVAGIVVVGQSMGGTLALEAALRRRDVVGVVTINAIGLPADPDVVEHLEYMIERGKLLQPAGAPDICDPHADDMSYPHQPRPALLEMTRGAGGVAARLGEIDVPVLVVSGDHDATIDPANSDAIAAGVAGPVQRLRLPNSAHVATLDLDKEALADAVLTWLATLGENRPAPQRR